MAATSVMRERKEPRFVQFADGDVVRGVLTAIESAEVNGKKTSRFVVLEEDGDPDCGNMAAFLGTVQINTKLRRSDLGHTIEVRCEGTDKNVVKNGNAMKKFRVFVSDDKDQAADTALITDDDIPF